MTTRVVILGGGFGGIHAVLGFDRLSDGKDFDVTLINRDNFFVFPRDIVQLKVFEPEGAVAQSATSVKSGS